MPRGRKSMFDKPMTELERQHRCTERKTTIALCASTPLFAIAAGCFGQILVLGYTVWATNMAAELAALF